MRMNLFVVGFCSLFILIGLGLSISGLMAIREARASALWLTTPGLITQSRIVSKPTENSRTLFPEVNYWYRVGSQDYQGTRIIIGGHISSQDGSRARKYTERYPQGAEVRVYYNADQPASSVLETGLFKTQFVPVVIGLGFAGFGAWFLVLFWLMRD